MSEAAMRTVVGDHSVTEVLTVGPRGDCGQAKELLSAAVRALRHRHRRPAARAAGRRTRRTPVKPAFNEVNQAIQEKERAINEAWAEYNQAMPRAKGAAEQAIQAAEGYALERVNRAKGTPSASRRSTSEYRKAPAVTRNAPLPRDDVGRAARSRARKVILDEKAKGVLPLFQLGPNEDAA